MTPTVIAPSRLRSPAVPDDQRERERREELDDREEERVVRDRAQVGAQVVLVQLREPGRVGFLAVEELHDPDAGDVLVDERVHACEPDADVAVHPCGSWRGRGTR